MTVGVGDRPLTIQRGFPLWIDCHAYGGVHRAALPLVNSPRFPYTSTLVILAAREVPRASADRASKSSSSRPAAGCRQPAFSLSMATTPSLKLIDPAVISSLGRSSLPTRGLSARIGAAKLGTVLCVSIARDTLRPDL